MTLVVIMENVIIVNEENFKNKKENIKSSGVDSFQIVSDFDRTLTKAFVDGKKSNTSFAQIREGNVLPKEYEDKANALFNKYYPIEINPRIPKEEKKYVMTEWFRAHLQLMVDYKLNKNIIEEIARKKVVPREGFEDLLKFSSSHKIPFVILSSGVGDIIREFLFHKKLFSDNVHLISNLFEWKDGIAVLVREPVIASFNKSSFEVTDKEFLKTLENRINVLVLGDAISDLEMIKPEKFDNVLSIGFVNMFVEEHLEEYKKHFDVLITNDGSLDFVNQLLKDLFN